MTEWRSVFSKGHEWLVSRDGRVKRPERRVPYTTMKGGRQNQFFAVFKEKEVPAFKSNMGYLEVAYTVERKRVRENLHRLVAMAYVPGFEEGLVVNHINGDKLDNRPENLEWTTKGGNTRHAWETGLVNLRGENQTYCKLSAEQVAHIRKLLQEGANVRSLSVVAGVSDSLLYKIKDGGRWPGVDAA